MKKILIIFIMLFCVVTLCSCDSSIGNKDNEKYTITYNLDGGELPTDAVKTFTDGSKVALPYPTKDNYIFKGWFDKDNNPVEDLKGVMADVTLYAKWEEFVEGVSYKIEYILNNGFFDQEVNYTYTTGTEYILPIPVKPGYNFIAWCDYETNEEVKSVGLTTNKDVKVYAWFEKATIIRDITYHVDGGELPSNTKYTYTEGTSQGLPNPKKEGYYFRGWYTSNTFEKNVIAITNNTYGDKELYAKWVEATIENANIAILGDSISTFYDPSSKFNSLFSGNNQYYYPKYSQTVTSVTQTWWYKTVEAVGGNLLVSNSYSGGTVCGSGMSSGNSLERIAKFTYKGQSPDIIIIYLGINDAVGKTPKETFKKEYQEMLDKIRLIYTDVQIFMCSLPYETYTDGVYRLQYNEVLNELATSNNLPLIDFSNAWDSSTEVKNNWLYLGDNIHPSLKGMNVLSSIASKKIKEFYGIA